MKMLVLCADALNLMDAATHGIAKEFSQYTAAEMPFTAPAWASFTTGLSPQEHGIDTPGLWDNGKIKDAGCLSPAGQEKILWRIINRHGLSVGWYLLPVVGFPPPILNGFSVSGGVWWPYSSFPAREVTITPMHHDAIIQASADVSAEELLVQDSRVIEECSRCIKEEVAYCLNLVKERPVDVLFVYTWAIDIATHWLYSNQDCFHTVLDTVAEQFELLENECNPEITVVGSDHGGQAHTNANFVIPGILPRAKIAVGRHDNPDKQYKFALGDHHPIGMFSASRPFAPPSLRVYDITSAYRWILGLLEIEDVYSNEEQEVIEDRLRGFGYLS